MKKLTTRDIQSLKTKTNIREAANSLFSTKDYDKVKVVDICKRAGVSTGAFYHYYHSKEDIINDTYNEFDLYAEEEMKNRTFDSRTAAILFLLYFEVKSIVDRGYIFTSCYFKNQLTNKERNIINKDRFFYKQLLKEVTGAIANGEIKYESAEKLTDFLLRITRGSIYNWCLHSGNYNLVEQTTEDIQFILESIR
ncbi:TetR/AcrR family transcriptional regulator [Irregularibacter muris]|uniref:TetR/AcrR family transcriptional regulator n=1 Tax=Irregularibacter muris TaxID=1796619 RepID=A0AAE3HG38_9FIRM|nr:TetR/AcrR family transcriptional regulator [Irregularibacter muris]MCR1898794.1 TetR/AcrR family transcriptional regulator [Irregularibacter muris]